MSKWILHITNTLNNWTKRRYRTHFETACPPPVLNCARSQHPQTGTDNPPISIFALRDEAGRYLVDAYEVIGQMGNGSKYLTTFRVGICSHFGGHDAWYFVAGRL